MPRTTTCTYVNRAVAFWLCLAGMFSPDSGAAAAAAVATVAACRDANTTNDNVENDYGDGLTLSLRERINWHGFADTMRSV